MESTKKNKTVKNFKLSEKLGNLRAVLIGNPNVGKTTLFNRLTGSAQYVGNWPGVTVERKEGIVRHNHEKIKIVDLPGVYSLSPFSPEEIITREYLINRNINLIINIIDATNIERNLYLTTQLLEFNIPIIIVLNMSDLLEKQGKIVDFCEFERILKIPVIPISAGKNIGIDTLVEKIFYVVKKKDFENFKFNQTIPKLSIYDNLVENKIKKIENVIDDLNKNIQNKNFILVKILEGDQIVISSLKLNYETIKKIDEIRVLNTIEIEEKIATGRYNFASEICKRIISDTGKIKKAKISRKIDRIITGKYTAIPIFLLIILTIFYVSFGPLGSLLEESVRFIIENGISNPIIKILEQFSVNKIIIGLFGAVLGGIGEVISFLPQMLLLFGLISVLEDSGYMARAAFVVDNPMRKIGLSGRAFVPLLMGFGCSVPAILSTRILESKKEKNLAIFLIPFMSCGAKMPVYLIFINAFFPDHKVLAIFLLYMLGAVFAILTSLLFKNVFSDPSATMIMELPDYKIPSLQNIFLNMWERIKDFLERAGTVIFGSTVVIWFLQSFSLSLKFVQDSSQSILASLGNFLAPIFNFCGFGNWRACIALITGMISKETIVSTMSVVYRSGEILMLKEALTSEFSVASAIAFMTFVLLYPPCTAAIAISKKEFGSGVLAFLSVSYQMILAWIVSIVVFRITLVLGHF
ncbi:MAG: ferrous iron transport protein B [Oscillospiraceae bacterium]|jgi:ferrous iron transport protein B|nr:ferrous iron transport protein B [Oscillospiraceae bacterium]